MYEHFAIKELCFVHMSHNETKLQIKTKPKSLFAIRAHKTLISFLPLECMCIHITFWKQTTQTVHNFIYQMAWVAWDVLCRYVLLTKSIYGTLNISTLHKDNVYSIIFMYSVGQYHLIYKIYVSRKGQRRHNSDLPVIYSQLDDNPMGSYYSVQCTIRI